MKNWLRLKPVYKNEEWEAWAQMVGVSNPGGGHLYYGFEYNGSSDPLGAGGLPNTSADPGVDPLGTFDQVVALLLLLNRLLLEFLLHLLVMYLLP